MNTEGGHTHLVPALAVAMKTDNWVSQGIRLRDTKLHGVREGTKTIFFTGGGTELWI